MLFLEDAFAGDFVRLFLLCGSSLFLRFLVLFAKFFRGFLVVDILRNRLEFFLCKGDGIHKILLLFRLGTLFRFLKLQKDWRLLVFWKVLIIRYFRLVLQDIVLKILIEEEWIVEGGNFFLLAVSIRESVTKNVFIN